MRRLAILGFLTFFSTFMSSPMVLAGGRAYNERRVYYPGSWIQDCNELLAGLRQLRGSKSFLAASKDGGLELHFTGSEKTMAGVQYYAYSIFKVNWLYRKEIHNFYLTRRGPIINSEFSDDGKSLMVESFNGTTWVIDVDVKSDEFDD